VALEGTKGDFGQLRAKEEIEVLNLPSF